MGTTTRTDLENIEDVEDRRRETPDTRTMTTTFMQLARQAEAFGASDPKNKGAWNLVAEAFSLRDLFLAGWRLACIGNEDSRRMEDWVRQRMPMLIREISS